MGDWEDLETTAAVRMGFSAYELVAARFLFGGAYHSTLGSSGH
jgi:hypothetical protein